MAYCMCTVGEVSHVMKASVVLVRAAEWSKAIHRSGPEIVSWLPL